MRRCGMTTRSRCGRRPPSRRSGNCAASASGTWTVQKADAGPLSDSRSQPCDDCLCAGVVRRPRVAAEEGFSCGEAAAARRRRLAPGLPGLRAPAAGGAGADEGHVGVAAALHTTRGCTAGKIAGMPYEIAGRPSLYCLDKRQHEFVQKCSDSRRALCVVWTVYDTNSSRSTQGRHWKHAPVGGHKVVVEVMVRTSTCCLGHLNMCCGIDLSISYSEMHS